MDINKMMTNGIFTMNDKHTLPLEIYKRSCVFMNNYNCSG